MAETRVGRVVSWRQLSSLLAIFRLMPQDGTRFPDYKAGQYIALRREDCKLTRREIGPDGKPRYVHVLDESGQPKRGPVTHSYSICSAPFETREQAHLEFYIVEEIDVLGPGRLTESLFRVNPVEDDVIKYVHRIVGDFTLDKRAAGFNSVLWVGTGTGLAPFASMVKQLDFEAGQGQRPDVRFTLLHTNRTREELAYHGELQAIEAAQRFDFAYVPSVSRPTPEDHRDPSLGRGRANNLLRLIFGMPLREEEELQEVAASAGDVAKAKSALEKAVKPALPSRLSLEPLRGRLIPAETVILTCGNASLMADIKRVADAQGIRFEKEDW